MRLWLLDADVVIKFLEINVFDKLAVLHELRVASTVIDEVKYYRRNGKKIPVNFRLQYIDSGAVIESTAAIEELQNVLKCLPPLKRDNIHAGEMESLAILMREEALTLCTFDAAAIRTLPFLGMSERAISAEQLLIVSGFTLATGHKLDFRLSEFYFRGKLDEGKKDFIYSIGPTHCCPK
ncbi:MAG: hypothetical protein CSYNP_03185 [Syntrophus sp. SKADARSKE-3]|nr:hypothetical protein [Syntrophus sp. SKADARSKE-3]